VNDTIRARRAQPSLSQHVLRRIPRASFLPSLLLLLVLLLFWAIALHNLTIVPPVYEDEPWQASTGWKIATQGIFGSDLFAGFYGMDQHYYGFMPLHPFLLALIFRIAGLGLFQTRFEVVALGLVTLALTFSLARRLFHDWRIALLAIVFLLSVRSIGLTYIQHTGILLLDMTRIARYDMLVPVFGLGALHAYLVARKHHQARWYAFTGLLTAGAGLAHLYGLFWLPVLIILIGWDEHGTRGELGATLAALLFGFALPWLPYAAYVAGNIYDWRGQTRGYSNRFDLLHLGWYVENVRTELRRYGPGLGSLPAALTRIGFWSMLIALPLAFSALAWRAARYGDRAARVIVVPLILLPILFALLLQLKLVNYTLTIAPFAAIAVAWGGVALWDKLGHTPARRLARIALAALLLGIGIEGITRVIALENAAQTTTPYYQFIRQVRQSIPARSRVLALHNYWFGLEDFDFRSFIVPLGWTDRQNEPRPLSFDEGLERIAPDIVLLDERMRDYFFNIAITDDSKPREFYRWLNAHHGTLVGRVDDPTYGLIEIYAVTH